MKLTKFAKRPADESTIKTSKLTDLGGWLWVESFSKSLQARAMAIMAKKLRFNERVKQDWIAGGRVGTLQHALNVANGKRGAELKAKSKASRERAAAKRAKNSGVSAKIIPIRPDIVPISGGVSERNIKAFYSSKEWLTSKPRYSALRASKGRCQCCGATKNEVRLVVDHIKPVRKYWELRFDADNLQVLCDPCNLGKGSWDETDWRNVGKAQ